LAAVNAEAKSFNIPVYPLPTRRDGTLPDGSDLPAFAAELAKKGCKDILIFLAGHGRAGTAGVEVARDNNGTADRVVSADNLRTTLYVNHGTNFKIIIDSCYSGLFVTQLPKSIKNLLVLNVSSSATQVSYNGYATIVFDDKGVEHDRAAPAALYPASGFVLNFTAGWNTFANSQEAVKAAQAAGGSLFAQMIAQGQALGGGLDWPASVHATRPETVRLNLPSPAAPVTPAPSPGSSLPPPTSTPTPSPTPSTSLQQLIGGNSIGFSDFRECTGSKIGLHIFFIGYPAGTEVVIKLSGPGLPPSLTLTITLLPGTNVSQHYAYYWPTHGSGKWADQVVSIDGKPPPSTMRLTSSSQSWPC
jgi:hypothetical protein